MEEKYVALAIPFFILMMGVEGLIARRTPGLRYRFSDAITSLSCGVGQQVLEPFLRTLGIAAYVFLYAKVRVFTVPASSVAGWVVLLLGVDFFYYVFHRASHRVNVFWASHVVHHQSEEYNLSTALRQSWLEIIFTWVFYLPARRRRASRPLVVRDDEHPQHALPVLDPYPPREAAPGAARVGAQHAEPSSRSSRREPQVHRQELRRHLHRVGSTPRDVPGRGGGARLRNGEAARELEPRLGQRALLGRDGGDELARAARARQGARLVRPARVAPARAVGRARVRDDPRGQPRDAEEVPTPMRVSRGLKAYVGTVHFGLVAAAGSALLHFSETAPAWPSATFATRFLVELIAWGGLLEGKPWGVGLALARIAADGRRGRVVHARGRPLAPVVLADHRGGVDRRRGVARALPAGHR